MDEHASPSGEDRFCPSCGHYQTDAGEFCSACGRPIHGADDEFPYPWMPWAIASIAVVVAVVGIGVGIAALMQDDAPTSAPPVVATSTTEPSTTTTVAPTTITTETTAAPGLNDAQLAAQFGDAVFKIEASGCGITDIATGFAIDPHHILTSRHAVAVDTTPTVHARDGRQFDGRVIGWEETPDMAVIEVAEDLTVWLDWVEAKALTEGQRLVTLGYPLPDHDFSVSPGVIVSFVNEERSRSGIRCDARLNRGNSGGPSLISDGLVAGLVTNMNRDPGDYEFVPIIVPGAEIADTIAWIIEHPSTPSINCEEIGSENPPATLVPTTTIPPPDYDHPPPPFHTVIVASMGTATTSYDDALERADWFGWEYGLEAGVLFSDDFSSLTPGYWVVYIGVFYDRTDAIDYAAYLREYNIDAYAREITW